MAAARVTFSAHELAPELARNLLLPGVADELGPKQARLAAAGAADVLSVEAARCERAAENEERPKRRDIARGSGGVQIRKTGHCKGSTIVRAFTTSRIQESTRSALAPPGSALRKAAPVQFRAARGADDGQARAASGGQTAIPGARHPVDVVLEGSEYGTRRRREEDELEFYRDLDRFFRRPIEPPEGVLRKERAFAIMKARGETNRLNANLPPAEKAALGRLTGRRLDHLAATQPPSGSLTMNAPSVDELLEARTDVVVADARPLADAVERAQTSSVTHGGSKAAIAARLRLIQVELAPRLVPLNKRHDFIKAGMIRTHPLGLVTEQQPVDVPAGSAGAAAAAGFRRPPGRNPPRSPASSTSPTVTSAPSLVAPRGHGGGGGGVLPSPPRRAQPPVLRGNPSRGIPMPTTSPAEMASSTYDAAATQSTLAPSSHGVSAPDLGVDGSTMTVQFAVQRGKTPKATMRKLQVEASRPKVHPPIVITDDFRRQLVRHMSMQAYSGGTWKRN